MECKQGAKSVGRCEVTFRVAPSFSASDKYMGKSNVASFAEYVGFRVRFVTGVCCFLLKTETTTNLQGQSRKISE